MCGRYQLDTELVEGEDLLGAILEFRLSPRFNAAPMQYLPIVRREQNGLSARTLRWGLIPTWAPDESFATKTINARSETVREKPAFREAFRLGRCLVPTTGFYEWKSHGRQKNPHLIRMQSSGVFAMAGLWSPWSNGEISLETFSILTIDPEGAIGDLHHRMPVILSAEAQRRWLDPEASPEELTSLLRPRRAEELEIFAVSHRVNAVANDDPDCARPAAVQQTLL